MPRASRRRRRSPGRGLGKTVLFGIAATFTVVLLVGSLLAIHTQSQGYRDATTRGYAALADQVGQASARTGARLSSLMAGAGALPDRAYPYTARGVLQQGLDSAVRDTSDQAVQAATIASPPAVGDLSDRFTSAIRLRASATVRLRTTVDRLLGMQPLPVAGAPAPAAPATTTAPATLISVDQAAAEMSAEGLAFEQSDADLRALRAAAAALRAPFHLHPSVWVPAPASTAPLGSAALAATATSLASAKALVPVHRLVVTAVGLNPPAVPTGGTGIVATTCASPTSATPGATPTVVPPTTTVAALVTVTNCGTVPESGVSVTVTVSPADPPGTAPPPPGESGGRSRARVMLAPGASVAPALAPLPVSSAHRYTVTVSVSLPPGQTDPAGSTQQFLVQVVG
ncbi:MAG TPA: hypothetical protein VND44_01815 [Acidimicrobiales bacterium]|nr:hypothetical protein [Acidimicrobiales bacterium]